MRQVAALGPQPNKVLRPARMETDRTIEPPARDGLAMLLERQQRAKLPTLYGMRTTTPAGKGALVKIGISEVVDHGSEVVVLFSVVNPQAHHVEILKPQILMQGKLTQGYRVT